MKYILSTLLLSFALITQAQINFIEIAEFSQGESEAEYFLTNTLQENEVYWVEMRRSFEDGLSVAVSDEVGELLFDIPIELNEEGTSSSQVVIGDWTTNGLFDHEDQFYATLSVFDQDPSTIEILSAQSVVIDEVGWARYGIHSIDLESGEIVDQYYFDGYHLSIYFTSGGAAMLYYWPYDEGVSHVSFDPKRFVLFGLEGSLPCCNSHVVPDVEVGTGLGEEINHENGFQLFPNPAQDIVHLRGLEGETLRVFDDKGALIHEQNVPESGIFEVQVSNWASGTYHFLDIGTELISRSMLKP